MREGGRFAGRAGSCCCVGGCLTAALLGLDGGDGLPAAAVPGVGTALGPTDGAVLLPEWCATAAGCECLPGSLPSLLPARGAGWAPAGVNPSCCTTACSCSRMAMALAARCASVSTGARRCCSAEAGRPTTPPAAPLLLPVLLPLPLVEEAMWLALAMSACRRAAVETRCCRRAAAFVRTSGGTGLPPCDATEAVALPGRLAAADLPSSAIKKGLADRGAGLCWRAEGWRPQPSQRATAAGCGSPPPARPKPPCLAAALRRLCLSSWAPCGAHACCLGLGGAQSGLVGPPRLTGDPDFLRGLISKMRS